MFTYVLNKLKSNLWMALCLLTGNILLISISVCSPMYSDAVLQRMLLRELQVEMDNTGINPGIVEFRGQYALSGPTPGKYEKLLEMEQLSEAFAAACPTPVLYQVREYFKTEIRASHQTTSGGSTFAARVEGIGGFEDHVRIIDGRLPSSETKDSTLEAIVSQKTLMSSNLYVGETIVFEKLLDSEKKPYKVEIVGIFEPKEEDDAFWFYNPNQADHFLYVNQQAFYDLWIADEQSRQQFSQTDYVILDHTQIRGSDVAGLLSVTRSFEEQMNTIYTGGMTPRYKAVLETYEDNARRLNVTLIVLQVPVFLLLGAFIMMVSSQMLGMDQNEIAMIKSRGASRRQILTIYLLQSLLIALVSLLISLPLGYLLCQSVGSANAFMEFVQRRALSVRFSLTVWLFAVFSALLGVLAMVIPAFSYSRIGIVDHKRAKHHASKPFWEKFFLDLVLLAVSLYGLYSYHQQSAFLAAQLEGGASLDPLLYAISSMFILGCALLFVRIFPWIIKLIFTLFKKKWSPGLYASFLRMLRTRGNQSFIMIFLVLTLALGIFSAQTARTINANAEEKIKYQYGADLVFQETWKGRQYASADGSIKTLYVEPDFHRYEKLEGAASFTKVYKNTCTVSIGSKTVKDVPIMGIETKAFGESVYMKDGLLDDHWYYYLNAMSQDPEGILVSTAYRDRMGLKLGDHISYQGASKSVVRGTIYGFVDYFPSMVPPEVSQAEDSLFIIAHLSYLQSKWGMEPYQIWMKNASDSSAYIYEFAEQEGVSFVYFTDTNAALIELKNDPVFQATNGILTVGFIVVLLLCSVGFLIYWILSIKSRQLQFGIFRAMGMTMKEILVMLLNEQIFLSVLSMIVGALVGRLAGKLFVPMIQMAYSSADQLIPLTVTSALSDEIHLYLVVGAVMIICMLILGRIVKRIKIAQALKLGED
ncbi:MAG: FtsX-like permease family protein [Firmicutes bacterium]|nr:FtsX-like permease family protein [Bacillota bacterium]